MVIISKFAALGQIDIWPSNVLPALLSLLGQLRIDAYVPFLRCACLGILLDCLTIDLPYGNALHGWGMDWVFNFRYDLRTAEASRVW
jgi:hypothetical protein